MREGCIFSQFFPVKVLIKTDLQYENKTSFIFTCDHILKFLFKMDERPKTKTIKILKKKHIGQNLDYLEHIKKSHHIHEPLIINPIGGKFNKYIG